jgi:biopolymer transport protein ExbD
MQLEPQESSYQEGSLIDMAPMIDCVFLLLIFFIVSSVFVADPGIVVEKPDVAGTVSADQNALLLAISADERIYFDGQELALDQVASVLRQAAFGKDQPLIIRADQAARHGIFAKVYAEAKRAGIPQVQFATAQAGRPED